MAAARVMAHERIIIDDDARKAIVTGRCISVTPMECGILSALLHMPNTTFSRQELLNYAAGLDSPTSERAVDVHVASLRRKLGVAGERIQAVRGEGYRYVAE